MLNRLALYSKFLLPICIFGYAFIANTAVLIDIFDHEKDAELSGLSVMNGEVASAVNEIYKSKLVQRQTAIEMVGAARYALLNTGRDGVVVGDDDWFFTKEEFETELDPEQSLKLTLDNIVYYEKILKAHGIELVMVPLPAKSDIYGDKLSKLQRASAVSDRYATFVDSLIEENINVVATRLTLKNSKRENDVFLKSDTHWSPFGAHQVAKAVANSISLKEYEIEDGSFELYTVGDVSFWGDLTNYITSENLAPIVGLHQENVHLMVAEEQAADGELSDLFGDDVRHDIVLVGTSYSANENWSFVEYLKAELSADVLNLSEEGQGPATPMLNYLHGDLIDEIDTKIVIWEFPVRYLGQKILWSKLDDFEADPNDFVQHLNAEKGVSRDG